MKKLIRKLVPQKVVNVGKHLPLAVLANVKNGFPSKKIKVIGVTGTDGKTTTVNMIYKVLSDAGKKVSMISTVNAMVSGKAYETGFHVTSPNPNDIQKFLKMAVKNGDEYLILETTSHAIDQFRVWGVRYDIGVVTNITHEHLDYHKTWENYFKAKAKLISNARVAIINKDEKHFERLKRLAKGKVFSFGMHKTADFNPQKFPIKLSVPGEFNMMNALAASAVGVQVGIDSKSIKKSLLEFQTPKGRLEKIENDRGVHIYVDFAHTPNGLENAIKALKSSHRGGKMISIFGAEGYRDQEKRGMMGEVSVKNADYSIVTDVDSRGLIDSINKMILKGTEKVGGKLGENVFVENDREKAVDFAINTLAKKGDIVGIFGKGHELTMDTTGQGDTPWSDYTAVKKALNKN
jgi:UDP-N-acetylmuramoyl-L-alanyl-D-glutamate--2,6-diaminopimelate ligase